MNLLLLFVPLTGCTAIILNDAATAGAPCESASDCASAQRCTGDVCVDDDRAATLPAAPTRVGPDGGLVPGPDGVLLEVPQDALGDDTNITITRTSSTTILDGLVARSRFYTINPDLPLGAAATVTLPLDARCAACAVYRKTDAGFVALPIVAHTDDLLSCTTAALGLFVAAEPDGGQP